MLVATVDILRAKGYSADVTNQFDRVLDDYDVTDLDVLVFGGMVPADTKQQLREDISERNPHVTVVQGLAGIAGLIAAQVQAATSADAVDSGDVVYDAAQRSVRITLTDAAVPVTVTIEAWWATSFVPPEPKSASMHVFDGPLDAGSHIIRLPDQVPSEASFAGVTVGSFSSACSPSAPCPVPSRGWRLPRPRTIDFPRSARSRRAVMTGNASRVGRVRAGRIWTPSARPDVKRTAWA